MKPLNGEITGLAFIGEGIARMTPPNRTERYMLEQQYGADRLDEPFQEAVIRFCDDTEDLILRHGTLVAPSGAERAEEIFGERNEWLNGRRSLALEARYLELRLSNLEGLDYFIAEFHSAEHGWLTLLPRPAELSRERPVHVTDPRHPRQTLPGAVERLASGGRLRAAGALSTPSGQ